MKVKMTLSKALKEKNRLVRNLKRNQDLLKSNNSYDERRKPRVDLEDCFENMVGDRDNLIVLKAAIYEANAPIAYKLFAISESRAEADFYKNSLNTTEGPVDERGTFGGETTVRTYIAYISEDTKQQRITEIEEQIDKLQDEIDAFNAVTEIEVDFIP